MTRLYGRAPRGQRLVDRTPQGHWVNNTYICGLRHNGIVAPHAFVGVMNAARFVDYIGTILLPTLRKGDMVIMDNLSAHLDGRVKPLVESKGASVLYLPAYSPDLNPIELSFSKLKSLLRKEKIRDVPTLQEFLRKSALFFTKKECKAYFKHRGYTEYKNRNALNAKIYPKFNNTFAENKQKLGDGLGRWECHSFWGGKTFCTTKRWGGFSCENNHPAAAQYSAKRSPLVFLICWHVYFTTVHNCSHTRSPISLVPKPIFPAA